MSRRAPAETEIAAPLVGWFREQGYEVYQEVQVSSTGGRADIVAVLEPIVWVVECKKSLGLDVISQADAWREYAHRISIAAQSTSFGGRRARALALEICRWKGIGMFEVNVYLQRYGRDCQTLDKPELHGHIHHRIEPRLLRNPPQVRILRGLLTEEMKTYAPAGDNSGRFWSPYKATLRNAHDAVLARPGMTTRELVESIVHHYAHDRSAIGVLRADLEAGRVEGVVGRRDGRKTRWYPKEFTPASIASSPGDQVNLLGGR